jgi:hypothetical protein
VAKNPTFGGAANDKSIDGSQNDEIKMGQDGKLTLDDNDNDLDGEANRTEDKIKPMPITKQSFIILQKENQALKERVKEVRIILNKEVNDLKDLLKDTNRSN